MTWTELFASWMVVILMVVQSPFVKTAVVEAEEAETVVAAEAAVTEAGAETEGAEVGTEEETAEETEMTTETGMMIGTETEIVMTEIETMTDAIGIVMKGTEMMTKVGKKTKKRVQKETEKKETKCRSVALYNLDS